MEKTKKENASILENIKKMKEGLEPKLSEISKSKKEAENKLKEAKEKYDNANRLNEENTAII